MSYYTKSGLKGWEAAVDIVWALLNTKEFIYKH